MATSEGIPSSIDIEFLELNDNPYITRVSRLHKIAIAADGYDIFELLQIHFALSLQINCVMLPIGQNTHQVLGR